MRLTGEETGNLGYTNFYFSNENPIPCSKSLFIR